MSSRRGTVSNEYDQGTARYDTPRSWRDPTRGSRNQPQGIRQPQYRTEQLPEIDVAERIPHVQIPQTRLGRAQAIIANVFEDTDDSNYVRRHHNLNQLLSIMTEKAPLKGDTAMWISENLQLMDLLFHGYANYPALDSVFDDPKASAAFKSSTIKLLAAVAECVRMDLFAEWIFERLLFSTASGLPEKERERYKERSICLLNTLYQVVENSKSNPMLHRQLATITPYILNNLMTVLDTVSSSDQIPIILKIMLAISAGYPQLIDASFQDIVDLLMGWQTDPSVSVSVHSAIEEFHYNMRPFWSARITFAFDLLRHLIIDITTATDVLAIQTSSNKDKQDAVKAVKAFLACFHSIMRAISPLISAQNDANSFALGPTFDEIRTNMFSCIWALMELPIPSEWSKKANVVMLELAQVRKANFQPLQWSMYTIIVNPQDHHEQSEQLEILCQAYKAWLPNVGEHILEAMLDPNRSPIIQLYFQSVDTKLKSAAQAFLRILLSQCHDSALQEHLTFAYTDELIVNRSELQKYLCSESQLDQNVSPGTLHNDCEKLHAVLSHSFDTNKLNSTQHRLTFFAHMALAACIEWPKYHQACIDNIIATIQSVWKCNCETAATELLGVMHKFYVSQGYFLKEVQSTYVHQMCDLLASAVGRWSYLSYKAKRIVTIWLKDATIAAESSSLAQSMIDPVITALYLAQESEENITIMKMVLSIPKDIRRLQLSTPVAVNIFPMLQQSMNDSVEETLSLASTIVKQLTPWLATSKIPMRNLYKHKIQTKILASPHTGNFRPSHFEQVMKFLTMEEYLPKMDHTITIDLIQDWCQRLFHHCETTASIQDTAKLSSLSEGQISVLNHNEDLLLYWVIWEAARYCMLSRMRTPCGGPQQTFSALERTLDKLLTRSLAQHDNENVIPLRYLVLLIDRLELQIYNASAGNATGALPSAPRSSIIFFRANRKTCRDWFAHIRGKMIASARVLCDDHMIIRQCWEALIEKEHHLRNSSHAEMSDLSSDMHQVMAVLVESLIRLRAVEVIDGLQKWHHSLSKFLAKRNASGTGDRETYGLISAPELAKKWFIVAGLFAQGCMESAISEYRALRSALEDGNHYADLLATLDNQAINYLTSIEEYGSLSDWIHNSKQGIDVFGTDILNDMFRAYASGSKSEAVMHAQLSPSSLEIWIEHMNVQQCVYLARLKDFRTHVISTIGGSSLQKMAELRQLVNTLLSTKFLTAVQADSHLKWYAQTEMSLLALGEKEHDIALCSWIDQWKHKFKRCDLEDMYGDPSHWARMGHYLCSIHSTGKSKIQNIESWIHASVIVARVCRWNKNHKAFERIISNVLMQYPECQQALLEKAKLLELRQDYTDAAAIYGQVVSVPTKQDRMDRMKAEAIIALTKLCKRRHWQAASSLLQAFDLNISCQNEADYIASITNLYELASQYAPEWPKVWFSYGTHCYRYGWQLLEDIKHQRGATSVTQQVLQALNVALNHESGSKQTSKDVATICSIFTHGSQCWNVEDESILAHFKGNIRSAFQHLPEPTISSLGQSFEMLQMTIISFFTRATVAYRQYLTLGLSEETDAKSTPSRKITCTLRLLRLLVKYGTCIQEQFRDLIDNDNITSWKLIIPQLFSRLNQPSSYARDIIWEILAKITRESPKNVMYELIVGCNSPKTSSESKQLLQQMASQLSASDFELMVKIKRMIEEMEKITVLWEEKWINKIAMLQFDATERLQRFEKELSRMKSGSSIDADHSNRALLDIYDAILMPVIVSIRQLIKETIDTGSDTPHEQWFQTTFGGPIRQAFTSLEKPNSWKAYRQGWDCFQKLHRELMKETNKMRVLKLSQLSPYLAQIKGTDIPMPGVQPDGKTCTIDSFVEDIIVLPTKTRPKKVDLKGSDNQIHPFLFKGLEDLHLDERIMQLMSTINDLMKGDLHGRNSGMKARHFAVIPISDHSGMIQWVVDATPLFALYKRWQQRENAAMVMTAEKQAHEKPPAVIQRPTEIFMEKISSALKREGLPVTASRRKWPKEVLKNVFLELQNETPNDLISKEVWCNSTTAGDWWEKSCSLARSMAVMSVIGYIIGLGDRHLDNTMVDFGSGEVVHIDFNVCFEKGKRLRVPELVPFRMTQNMVNALGITGTDGLFKITAEKVLTVLQRHKEALVTLLDAFVYDPLFDWSTEVEENQKKQMMDLQANFGLLSNRLDEVKQQLIDVERVIMDLLEFFCVQLETVQDTEESTNAPSAQQDIDDTGNEVTYAVEDLKQILSDVFPLLESIDIMQVEVDNELKIGQQNVKIILASIAKLEESIPSLITSSMTDDTDNKSGQQSKEKRIEECTLVMVTMKELFSAIKALEGYGTDVKVQNDVQQITNALEQLMLGKPSDEDREKLTAPRESSDELESTADPHAVYGGDGKLSDFDDTEALDDETNTEFLGLQSAGPVKSDQELKCIDTAKKSERRNHHAVGILRRIRSKIEGVDFGHIQAMSVSEHVSEMIAEARSIDNLSLMYEGWTSWV